MVLLYVLALVCPKPLVTCTKDDQLSVEGNEKGQQMYLLVDSS